MSKQTINGDEVEVRVFAPDGTMEASAALTEHELATVASKWPLVTRLLDLGQSRAMTINGTKNYPKATSKLSPSGLLSERNSPLTTVRFAEEWSGVHGSAGPRSPAADASLSMLLGQCLCVSPQALTSALNSLKHLPINRLKIDQSFVKHLPGDADDAAITSAIIAMGSALGLTVLAEGVERENQLEFLQARGCTEAQGYLFSEPVPEAEFRRLLTAWQGLSRLPETVG